MTDTTHTAPERIWTASTDGKCHVGFDTPSLNYVNEYVRLDLSTYAAGYGAALRDAAGLASALSHDGDFVAERILALIPADQPPGDYEIRGQVEYDPYAELARRAAD